MKKYQFLVLLILFLLAAIGCHNSKKAGEEEKFEKGGNHSNNFWVNYYNEKSNELSSLYSAEAIKILDNEEVRNGNTSIANYILNDDRKIEMYEEDTILMANKSRKIEYEFSKITYDNDDEDQFLIIWQSINNDRKRVFEFNVKIEDTNDDFDAIAERRNAWMKLCNAHDAEELINECYSANTIYFNHKPLVIGRVDLIGEYAYMNDPAYKLKLEPEMIKFVNKNTVFEMGQCIGSYNGKYILVWKKDADGVWRIYIDSNI